MVSAPPDLFKGGLNFQEVDLQGRWKNSTEIKGGTLVLGHVGFQMKNLKGGPVIINKSS